MGTRFDVSVFVALTEDPVKGPRTIAHLVRLQGFALSATGSERHMAGMATCRSGCDPYIYSESQSVCAILIRLFSVPSASEAL